MTSGCVNKSEIYLQCSTALTEHVCSITVSLFNLIWLFSIDDVLTQVESWAEIRSVKYSKPCV